MQVLESIWLSRYIKILKDNGKTTDEITILKKEYIDYVEGQKSKDLSNELIRFLSAISSPKDDEQVESSKKR